jgi:hypothetical protein
MRQIAGQGVHNTDPVWKEPVVRLGSAHFGADKYVPLSQVPAEDKCSKARAAAHQHVESSRGPGNQETWELSIRLLDDFQFYLYLGNWMELYVWVRDLLFMLSKTATAEGVCLAVMQTLPAVHQALYSFAMVNDFVPADFVKVYV